MKQVREISSNKIDSLCYNPLYKPNGFSYNQLVKRKPHYANRKPMVPSGRGYSRVKRIDKANWIGIIQKQFFEYATKWKTETGAHSNSLFKITNINYFKIIKLGEAVVPYILKDLEEGPEDWFMALRAITGENPVLKDHLSSRSKTTQDWLEWGKKRNLI